ncbi:hypothetical protein BDV12DRAFT_193397 [Aspergillus spectabilis]
MPSTNQTTTANTPFYTNSYNKREHTIANETSRLARRGGVYRIKKEIYDEIRVVLKERLTVTLRQVILVLESSQIPSCDRKLVTSRDVVYALNRMGTTLYGYGF